MAFTELSESIWQSHPHSDNPTTKIRFSLVFDSNVKLTVYNIAGEIVKELVNGNYKSGEHEITLSLSNIKGAASGI